MLFKDRFGLLQLLVLHGVAQRLEVNVDLLRSLHCDLLRDVVVDDDVGDGCETHHSRFWRRKRKV